MRDGPVYEDFKKFRDFDASHQADRHILKSIALSLTAVLLPLAFIYPYLETLLGVFLIEILLSMIFMGPIIFYYAGRNTTKMNMAHQGYNVDWSPERKRFFGYDSYSILRADPGTGQAAIAGFTTNPFVVSKRQLQEIEKKQRDNAVCESCGKELFEERIFDREGAYFVEDRKRLWVFGVPLKEKILGWDAYCPQHKPSESQYNTDSD